MRQNWIALSVICLALIAATGAVPSSSDAADNAPVVRTTADLPLSEVADREIIIELDPSRGAKSVSAFCSSTNLEHRRTRELSYATYEVVRVPEGQDYHDVLNTLAADPRVKVAAPNVIKRVSQAVPNDPLFLGAAPSYAEGLSEPYATNNQYALMVTGVTEAWELTTGVSSVIVAILDTGINLNHEDFDGRIWHNSAETADNSVDDDQNGFIDDVVGWDFTAVGQNADDNDPTDPSGDFISHGNATASIIGARRNNGIGMAGVAGGSSDSNGIRLMPLRVGTNSDIQLDSEIAAIDYAILMEADIISMSFGGASGGVAEENAINRAWNAGIYVCAASGNTGQGWRPDGKDAVDYPAAFDNCVAVGATTIFPSQTVSASSPVIDEEVASYSKTGPETELVAPGTHILCAAHTDDGYSSLSHQFTGTSAATPVVAGIAALYKSLNPSWTVQQLRDAMNAAAEDLGDSGRDELYGYGSVRAPQPDPTVVRGDANKDGNIDEADLAIIVSLDGVTSTSGDYIDEADYDANNTINSTDVLGVVAKIFEDAGTGDGDTDGDGDVDDDDAQVLRDKFGLKAGDTGYTALADADRNGVIDELDLFVVGRNYGN
ncbi:S8 family serine peptidase [bacterium]|nr:S8 family serine peptidase [bacterium]